MIIDRSNQNSQSIQPLNLKRTGSAIEFELLLAATQIYLQLFRINSIHTTLFASTYVNSTLYLCIV